MSAYEIDRTSHCVGSQARHHDTALVHAFRSFVGLADHDSGKTQQGRLLGKRAAVRNHAARVDLQPDVVEKSQRLHESYRRGDLHVTNGFQPLPSARVRGEQHRHLIFFDGSVQRLQQRAQAPGAVHVLLAMGADYEILATFQVVRVERARGIYLRAKVLQDFRHRRSGLDDALRGEPFRDQVSASVLGVRQIDVAGMVHDPPVNLLGHAIVEATVARFHMEHGYLAAFCHDDAETRVRISEEQHRVGFFAFEHAVEGFDDAGDRGGGRRAGCIQEVVRFTYAEIEKKYLVQLEIVILARVHQHVINRSIELGDGQAQLDQLRPGADQRDHLEIAHRSSSPPDASADSSISPLRSSSLTVFS